MKRNQLEPITPGEILLKEFLEPFSISMAQLAKDIHVPANRVTQIIKGDRDITADTALRLAAYFKTSPEFWLNLQSHYNLEILASERDEIFSDITEFKAMLA